jgi:hypothetical protein
VGIALNTDYTVTSLDALTLTALMTSMQGGSYSFEAYYSKLEKAGMYPDDWTIEQERSAIEAGMPMNDAGVVQQQKDQISLQQQKETLKQVKQTTQAGGNGNGNAPPAQPGGGRGQ